jgi:hypothetical protein
VSDVSVARRTSRAFRLLWWCCCLLRQEASEPGQQIHACITCSHPMLPSIHVSAYPLPVSAPRHRAACALGHVAAGASSAVDKDLLVERSDLVRLDDQIRVLHSSYLHSLLALSSKRRIQMRLVTAGSRAHEPRSWRYTSLDAVQRCCAAVPPRDMSLVAHEPREPRST